MFVWKRRNNTFLTKTETGISVWVASKLCCIYAYLKFIVFCLYFIVKNSLFRLQKQVCC